MNTKIYIYGHKPLKYGYWDNGLYCPLEVGAALHDEQVLKVRDNEGENISDWNGVYAEVTGLYWIWRQIEGAEGLNNSKGLRAAGAEGMKNLKGLKHIGTCQYRRRLEFAEDTDFDELFKEYDVIMAKPLRLGQSLARQYGNCHNIEDINFCGEIVKEMYPEYAADWDRYINEEGIIYYSSGMIMKKKDFINYCRWLFPIFDEFRNRMNFNAPEDVEKYVDNNIKLKKHNNARGLKYQMQIFGFLQERLLTLYVRHNFKNIKEIQYRKYEGV